MNIQIESVSSVQDAAKQANAAQRSAVWALGYLRGSADGYWRGTVTLRRVTSAVSLALRHGVSHNDVHEVLRGQRLYWHERPGIVSASDQPDEGTC